VKAPKSRAVLNRLDAALRAQDTKIGDALKARRLTADRQPQDPVEALIADMERVGRLRRRPDKWRTKFRRTMDSAIEALETASPLSRRDTWRALVYLSAARDAYAPEHKPAGQHADYSALRRRAQALAAAGKTAAQIVRELVPLGLSASTAWRYARDARKK
jgi:hypothetical protein